VQHKIRKRSEYVFEVPEDQISAFLELAQKKDQPLEEVILEALDKYIEKEKSECRKTS
jgi:uncharacterized Fe-S cluster-containing MiaB family protein